MSKPKKPPQPKQDNDTEWFTQAQITERTGMSASWVYAQGVNGTVRRRETGIWKGRPTYEFAYVDVIREADHQKVKGYQAALAPTPTPTPTVEPAVLGGLSGGSRRAPYAASSCPPVVDLDKMCAWLREGTLRGYITTVDAATTLLKKAKL
jgi:hypothetical protein